VSECARNFDTVVDIIAARSPDLVVNTGDIAFNGADDEDDLGYARSRHARLPVPFRAVPGNHDVGDDPWKPDVEQRITVERLDRYRRHFGPDYWRLEAGSWLLIGANAQLFGSGLAAEEEQWSFLATTAGEAGARPVALFLHKPLFDRHPGETDTGHRYVTPVNRHRLGEVLRAPAVRLVASGHVHQHRRWHVGDVEYCWAPSTAFVISDARQPRIGVKRLGYVEYTFRDDRVDVEVVEPSALVNHDLDAVWPPERQLNQSPSTTP
jgi:3',5'-cyclic AMP phosphodiesterase CpdA